MYSKTILVMTGIGVIILVTSSIGFANTLQSQTQFNLIGAGVATVPPAEASVNKVIWKDTGDFKEVLVSIKNTGSTLKEEFEICAILKDGSSISGAAGTTPDCCTIQDLNPNSVAEGKIILSIPLTGNEGIYIIVKQTDSGTYC